MPGAGHQTVIELLTGSPQLVTAILDNLGYTVPAAEPEILESTQSALELRPDRLVRLGQGHDALVVIVEVQVVLAVACGALDLDAPTDRRRALDAVTEADEDEIGRYAQLIVAMASEQAVVALEEMVAIKHRETIIDRAIAEGQREMLRRVLDRRFANPAITERVTIIRGELLLDAVERAVTGDADDFTAWLDAAITGPEPSTDPDWDARCAEIFASVEDLFECLRPEPGTRLSPKRAFLGLHPHGQRRTKYTLPPSTAG